MKIDLKASLSQDQKYFDMKEDSTMVLYYRRTIREHDHEKGGELK